MSKHTLTQCRGKHCRCMQLSECPNYHFADCELNKASQPTDDEKPTRIYTKFNAVGGDQGFEMEGTPNKDEIIAFYYQHMPHMKKKAMFSIESWVITEKKNGLIRIDNTV